MSNASTRAVELCRELHGEEQEEEEMVVVVVTRGRGFKARG